MLMVLSRSKCYYLEFGLLNYGEALALQDELAEARRKKLIDDILILLEHPPVITIGRSGSYDNILVQKDILDAERISVYKVDRGGDVTYHGLGQLVGYFIFDISYNRDIHEFVHKIEESIIQTLNEYGITARPERGVWVDNEKIAAIGMRVKDWITKHGFALNVNPNLDHYAMINPCGMREIKITSLSKLLQREISIYDIRRRYIKHFCNIFGLDTVETSIEKLREQIDS